MNKKLQNYIVSVSMVVITLAVSISAQKGNTGGGRLTGTWDAVVSITNCETGGVITTFQSTASFHQGGTSTGITSGVPPALRSPEVGIWRHEFDNKYSFRFKAYLFNAAGAPIAYQIITHEIELDENNLDYTSAGGVKIFALNGPPMGTGCSSAVGTRMLLD